MAGLRTSKVIKLPRIENIRDGETKKVLREIIRVIGEMNTNYYSDLVWLEGRIKALE